MTSLRDHANALRRKGVVKPTSRAMLAQGDEVHHHRIGFTGRQMLISIIIALFAGAAIALWMAAPSLKTQRLVNAAGSMTEIELTSRLALPANIANAIGEILEIEPSEESAIDDWLYLLGMGKAPSSSLSRKVFLKEFINAYAASESGAATFDDILDVSVLINRHETASIIKSLRKIKPAERSRIAGSLELASGEAELLFRVADSIATERNTALIDWLRQILIKQSTVSSKMEAILNYIWAHKNEDIKCSF